MHVHDYHAKTIGEQGIACTKCHAELDECDLAPAEARAEERGDIDPHPIVTLSTDGRVVGRTVVPLPAHRAWRYECAKIHWGSWDSHGNGTPGGAGKLLTGPEYDAYVEKAMGVTAR